MAFVSLSQRPLFHTPWGCTTQADFAVGVACLSQCIRHAVSYSWGHLFGRLSLCNPDSTQIHWQLNSVTGTLWHPIFLLCWVGGLKLVGWGMFPWWQPLCCTISEDFISLVSLQEWQWWRHLRAPGISLWCIQVYKGHCGVTAYSWKIWSYC